MACMCTMVPWHLLAHVGVTLQAYPVRFCPFCRLALSFGMCARSSGTCAELWKPRLSKPRLLGRQSSRPSTCKFQQLWAPPLVSDSSLLLQIYISLQSGCLVLAT